MDEIVAFAELEQFIDLPVRTYSSGMYMRLGFSVAAHIQADVLLLDEVFAVGDEEFQRKCFGKIAEFKNRGGTIVFVSHDAQAVERLCDRAVLLRQGEVAFDGADARGDRRATGGCSPTTRTRTSSRPGCGSGAAARRASSRRSCSTTTVTSASSSPPGEPSTSGSSSRRSRGRAAAACRSSCATTAGSCSARRRSDTAELGWNGGGGERELRFRLDRLPLADGRFHLRVALVDADERRAAARARRRAALLRLPGRRRDRRGAARRGAGRCRRSAPAAPTPRA